ncbi:MAG: primase-like DNA-binding domain-containing protein [Blautia producta]
MAISYGDDCIEKSVRTEKVHGSEHSKECVREVQRTSDSICAFIDESLVRAKGKRLKRSEVFHMYEEYCKENGRQGHGKSNFFRNMTDKGFLLKQYNGEFYYQDIAVKEEDFVL